LAVDLPVCSAARQVLQVLVALKLLVLKLPVLMELLVNLLVLEREQEAQRLVPLVGLGLRLVPELRALALLLVLQEVLQEVQV
jgi:hypothetical protein